MIHPAKQNALVIGAGGLGCPASLALAMARVPRITVVDPDRVELSNLHRQLWHRRSDIGRLKAESAASRLVDAFPDVGVEGVATLVDANNVDSLLQSHSVSIDGTDRSETKFMLSDAAVRCGRPLVYGGVVRMRGQAMLIAPGGPCLRCLFEEPPADGVDISCSAAGVLGSVAGVVGAIQASLALDVLRGRAEPGKLVLFDGHRLRYRLLHVRPAPGCPLCFPKPPAERASEAGMS